MIRAYGSIVLLACNRFSLPAIEVTIRGVVFSFRFCLLHNVLPSALSSQGGNPKSVQSISRKNRTRDNGYRKKFYSSFCDIIIENVKFLTISANELEQRFQITNHEVVDELYQQRRSAITTLGHMGNWEMAGLNASHTVGHHSLAIYKPLKNQHFDALARKMRARFGMELVAQNRMRHLLTTLDKEACLFHFITDQTPSGKALAIG